MFNDPPNNWVNHKHLLNPIAISCIVNDLIFSLSLAADIILPTDYFAVSGH